MSSEDNVFPKDLPIIDAFPNPFKKELEGMSYELPKVPDSEIIESVQQTFRKAAADYTVSLQYRNVDDYLDAADKIYNWLLKGDMPQVDEKL